MPLYIDTQEIPLDIESQGADAIGAYLASLAPAPVVPEPTPTPTPAVEPDAVSTPEPAPEIAPMNGVGE